MKVLTLETGESWRVLHSGGWHDEWPLGTEIKQGSCRRQTALPSLPLRNGKPVAIKYRLGASRVYQNS